MRREVRNWLPAGAWALCIWLIGGASEVPSPPLSFFGLDKIAHFCMYGLLAVLIARATRGTRSSALPGVALLLAVLLGAADEMRQLSVANRSGDPYDFVADVAGILVGFVLARRTYARADTPRR